MVDWLPGISQVKSLLQWACGDNEGALKTQLNFVKKCPGVAQVTGTVAIKVGQIYEEQGCIEFGEEIMRQEPENIDDLLNGTPVIGHIKGRIHHLFGDTENGNKALESASRAVAQMASDLAQWNAGDPVGNIIADQNQVGSDGVCAIVENNINNGDVPQDNSLAISEEDYYYF